MISDSAGHVAKNWSGLPTGRKGQCIPAQRAFLSSSSIFSPFLLDCECVTLRSDPRRIPEWQLSPVTVLLAAQLADRSCLSWDQEELVQLSVTASSPSPSAPFKDPLGHIKNRPKGKRKKKKKRRGGGTKWKIKNAGTTAHSNKRIRGKKIKYKQKGKKQKQKQNNSCLQYKTF